MSLYNVSQVSHRLHHHATYIEDTVSTSILRAKTVSEIFQKRFQLSGHNLVSAAMFRHLSQPSQHPHRITTVLFQSLTGFRDLNGFEFQIPKGMKKMEKKPLLSQSYRREGGGAQYPPAGFCLAILKGFVHVAGQ